MDLHFSPWGHDGTRTMTVSHPTAQRLRANRGETVKLGPTAAGNLDNRVLLGNR